MIGFGLPAIIKDKMAVFNYSRTSSMSDEEDCGEIRPSQLDEFTERKDN
jgi:hypothetical protein